MGRWKESLRLFGRWCKQLKQDNSLRFAGSAFANGADLFGGLEFQTTSAYIDFQRRRQIFANGRAKVFEFGPLENDGGIDVGDAIAFNGREALSFEEELDAVRGAPFGRGVGEVEADIAERERAQDGVGDGVGKDIGIGVAGETEFGGDFDTTENEITTGLEAVGVPALADAELGRVDHGVGRIF